jgi:hypothetical protein
MKYLLIKYMNTSEKYALNLTDLWKITRGALIVLGGALVTYISSIYMNVNYTVHLHGLIVDTSPIATVFIGSLLEAGRRYLTNYQGK